MDAMLKPWRSERAGFWGLTTEKVDVVEECGNVPELSKNLEQFASWRTARIRIALVLSCVYILTVALTCFGLRGTVASMVTDQLDKKYLQYFEHLTLTCMFERWCMLLGCVAAWIMAWRALGQNSRGGRFDLRSIDSIRWSVGLNVGVPLVLAVFIPFRGGVDVVSFRKEMCQDVILHLKENTGHFPLGNVLLSNVLHGTTAESQMRVCSSEPWDWGQRLVDFVAHSSRFTIQEECDAARDADVMGCLSGVQDDLTSKLNCLTDRSGLGGRRLGLPGGPMCIRTQELKDLELLADIISQVTAEKLVLGIMFGMKSLVLLLPVALAISTGIMHGGQCAQAVMPQTHFPGFVSLTVSLINLPCILVVLAFLQNVCGNFVTAIGIALFVLDYVINTKFWKTVPVSQSKQGLLESLPFQWCVRLLTMVFLIGGILLNTSLGNVIYILATYTMKNKASVLARIIISLRDVVGWSLLSFVLVYYGLALLLGVFFADAFVQLTYHFQSFAAQQDDEARAELWTEVECLRHILDPWNAQALPQLIAKAPSSYPRTLLEFPSCFASKMI
eukprot:TRINITY_DN36272_c0_g1_i1.p1 TRINITY_DN36272_c0_g1~~TRINITY_DN36272_c0_g1_i1.p1  ORF type:complete len:560 (+),score=94.83 TRINITY_DN36272_c0_g1_i1:100-1779(+)